MRTKRKSALQFFFTNLIFIVVPIAFGIALCAVLIYGGRSFYFFVMRKLEPVTYTIRNESQNTAQVVGMVAPKGNVITGAPAVMKELDKNNFINRLKVVLPRQTPLNLRAKAYLVADIDTGNIILEKNKNAVYPIASLTKLVTASVAQDLIRSSALIPITAAAYYTEGDTGHLRLDESIKAADLYYPLLMVSSNDAAEAFAHYYGRDTFIAAMNLKVFSWGAPNTHFFDASGLTPQNVSTSQDLFKIASAFYRNHPELIAITHTKTKSIKGHSWVNATHFLNMSSYIGGKNGYTEEADRTALLYFNVDDKDGHPHTLVIILLQSDNRDKDVLDVLNYLDHEF